MNVGGLVASTLNISDSDFMAGKYNFSGASTASILNQGSINADGGYVALLGANVSNQGVISAKLGTVALAAGNAMTLDMAGDGLLNVTVNQGAVNALAQNGGLIQADGGQVLLTAQAAGTLLQSVVNNTGVIQAQTIENHNGTIRLMGDMQNGTVNLSGTLDASAPNGGNGGFIETSATNVKIANDAKITTAAAHGLTGTWLIDPTDFTIGSVAGDDIAGVTLSALLVTNSVVIDTATGINATNAGATPPVTGYHDEYGGRRRRRYLRKRRGHLDADAEPYDIDIARRRGRERERGNHRHRRKLRGVLRTRYKRERCSDDDRWRRFAEGRTRSRHWGGHDDDHGQRCTECG